MDASSSVYQIMLLDKNLAMRTNLLGGNSDSVNDLYSSLIGELKDFLKSYLEEV